MARQKHTARRKASASTDSAPKVERALRDKNAIAPTQQTAKNTRAAKRHLRSCFPARLNEKKLVKAIVNDDPNALGQMIRANPDVLDYVDEEGKTLLHQCVDNCAKFGAMYSAVALDLISRGSLLTAKDKENKTVMQDAHEKGQHLLLGQMIKAYKETEIKSGRQLPVRGMLTGASESEPNRCVITNFKTLALKAGESKWNVVGRGCEAYLSSEGSVHVHIVDSVQEVVLSKTLDAIKQLAMRKANRVLMQVDPEDDNDRQCYLLAFETEYDAYQFSSIVSSQEQLRTHVE